ncbi:hypothetical protein D3C71_1724110 [compost metagenome]
MLFNQIFERNICPRCCQLRISCHHIGIILAGNHNPQLLVNVACQKFEIEAGARLIFNFLINFIVRCRLLAGFAQKHTDIERLNFVARVRSSCSLRRAGLFCLGIILGIAVVAVVIAAAAGECKAQG